MLLSSDASPLAKKVKMDMSAATLGSNLAMSLVAHGYSVDVRPTFFAYLLGDLLLLQWMEGQSTKTVHQLWMILLVTPFM